MPLPTLLPTSELVAIAFLGSAPGLSTQMVATTLPSDDSAWAASGFITLAVIGGSPGVYLPTKSPVLQVDCWAVKPGSSKPPWWKANHLAETVRYACLQRTGISRRLTITANGVTYPPAAVQSAYLLTEPQRRYSDAADYANYSLDMQMTWLTPADVLA